jgi:hypothetical protein
MMKSEDLRERLVREQIRALESAGPTTPEDRRYRLLVEGVGAAVYSSSGSPADISRLNRDLEALRSKVEEIQKQVVTDEQLKGKFEEVVQLVDRAEERGKELKARVLLPSEEDMTISLVPSHFVERLGEYYLENTVAFLLLGLFLGAVLGIVVNWATNEKFVVTNVSLVLISLFVLLATGSALWAFYMGRKSTAVRNQMLRHAVAAQAVAAQDKALQDSSMPQ